MGLGENDGEMSPIYVYDFEEFLKWNIRYDV